MIMTGKESGVAVFALATAGDGRAFARTGCGIMAGQATTGAMDLAATNKW